MTRASKMASISSEVATGRRIKGRDGFIARYGSPGSDGCRARHARESTAALGTASLSVFAARQLVGPRRPFLRIRRLTGVGVDHFYFRAFAQFVRAVDHHQVSRLDTALYLGGLAFHCADLHRRHRHRLILPDEEDK